MWRIIRLNLLAGVLVVLPLYLTYVILVEVFMLIDGILNSLMTKALVKALNLPLSDDQVFYGLGTIALLVILFFTGWIARNYFGKKLLVLFNQILDKIPFVKTIYKTLRQISEAVFSDKRQAFQQPILLQYPRLGLYTLAFKTQDTAGSVQNALNEDCISIFLPSTPNPTTGFLIFVPKSQVIPVKLTTEEAMKMIISGGAITAEQVSEMSAESSQDTSLSDDSSSGNEGSKTRS
ncbi:MAG: DUF502 domain-containing protein [bacterium]